MPRTVTVACKLPHGLQLRLHEMIEVSEPVMGGGTRTTKKAMPIGEVITVAGTATLFGKRPKVEIVGGYALTRNIDADFFAEWMRQNDDLKIVKQKLIFAYEKADRVRKVATENESIRTGLEPVSPDNDPRIGRGKITKFDDKAA